MWHKTILASLVVLSAVFVIAAEFRGGATMDDKNFPVLSPDEVSTAKAPAGKTELATFGTGCFWCTEAVFQQLKGVSKVVSGYSGGQVVNPSYRQVCTGLTGHAEVIQITYDPAVITFPELLEVFWRSHDPTTLNRQGNDFGPQYRSAIFTHTEQQKKQAELYKRKVDAAKVFSDPVVTEIVPFTVFYPAEDYHQNYYNQNSRQPYCRAIIRPKLDKLKAVFHEKLKDK
jgi:peptide-methionine (S)-S-oxide reductase